MTRLLVADDHAILIEGIRSWVEDTDINIVGSTGSAKDVVDLYAKHKPDVVICDIRFDEQNKGFEILGDLLNFDPSANVIMFSQYIEDQFIENTYKNGGKAFINKSTSVADLISAIQTVAKGEKYYDKTIAIRMMENSFKGESLGSNVGSESEAEAEKVLEKLTTREKDVLAGILKGQKEVEIANKLDIVVRTVANTKISLRHKFDVKNQAELIAKAIKLNIEPLLMEHIDE